MTQPATPNPCFVQVAQYEWLNLAFVVSAAVGGIGTDISVTFTLSSGDPKRAQGAYGQYAAQVIQGVLPSH